MVNGDQTTNPQKKNMNSDVSTTLKKINVIFDSSTPDASGYLDSRQTQYALEALGWYLDLEEMKKRMEELALKFPLKRPDFYKIVGAIETSGCKPEMCTVPQARRGISLKQLKSIQAGLLDTKWLSSCCEEFNLDHEVDIRNGGEYKLDEIPNLYSMDKLFVMQTTSCESNMRDKIPEEVLKAAKVPDVPEANCSYAQLLNPEGLEVDYFVSHFWGHPFEQTVQALTKFSEGVYKNIGKDNPDEIIFWICLFAVNQHQKAKEVGSSLEHAPFNVALAKAKYGAVMVLDDQAKPMKRIWCIYEISRAHEFNQPFQLITNEGDITNASVETLEKISDCLLHMSAYDANASDQSDKIKIQYQILNPAWKSNFGSTEGFKRRYAELTKVWFAHFDRHVCTLMGTPLLTAALKAKSKGVCTRAVRMGAKVTVANLEELSKLDVNVTEKFKTPFGMITLSIMYADMGLVDELRHILDQGVNVEEKAKDYHDQTALIRAATHNHTKVISLLLDRGADTEVKSNYGSTALDEAASCGQTKSIALLLDRGANIEAKRPNGNTSLHQAAYHSQTESFTLLLDRGADIKAKNNDGDTPFELAMKGGHTDITALLRNCGAEDDENAQKLEAANDPKAKEKKPRRCHV